MLIVGGGDGTISAAASALAGTETLLGILPLGTLNHFARDLGIPTELDEAAKLIAERTERRVDVAEMNGRVFINNSAIGLYPLMVVDRDLQRKRLGRSKRLAMIVASVRTLVRFKHQRLTLTVNDQKARVDTPLLFVGNNDYRVDIGAPGQRENLDDGQLCVLVMRKKTPARPHRRKRSRVAQSGAPRRHGAARRGRAVARRQPARKAGRFARRRSRSRLTAAGL